MDSPETLASLGTQKQDGDKEIKKNHTHNMGNYYPLQFTIQLISNKSYKRLVLSYSGICGNQ